MQMRVGRLWRETEKAFQYFLSRWQRRTPLKVDFFHLVQFLSELANLLISFFDFLLPIANSGVPFRDFSILGANLWSNTRSSFLGPGYRGAAVRGPTGE